MASVEYKIGHAPKAEWLAGLAYWRPRAGHVALLHRKAGKGARLLHLRDHLDLVDEDAPVDRPRLWVRPAVPDARMKQVASMARLVYRLNKQKQVPYAFSHPQGAFGKDGRLKNGPSCVGLTCSHFVLAVFDAACVRLVQYETWAQTEADKGWQESFLDDLRARGTASAEHVAAAEGELGNVRFPPEDVVGAAACEVVPAARADARARGDQLCGMVP